MTHLEYMQDQAAKNMDFHIQNMDNLLKEANSTATFLYLVISASFTGAVKLFADGKHPTFASGLALLCVYLAMLGIYLVFSCLRARDVESPANEPKNLKLQTGYTSEEIQEAELDNLQKRIDANRTRNDNTAHHLNFVRILICLSPLFFFAVISLAGLFRLIFGQCLT